MTKENPILGRYVVVRTYSAGVHVGVLQTLEGREALLSDSRRIWRWHGANTLNEISLTGVSVQSKVSAPVSEILLTEAIEVIPCTSEAEANLRAAKWAA